MVVVDSHVHFGGWGYGKGLPKLKTNEMLAEFDKNGVDKAVVFSANSIDFHSSNDEIQEAVLQAKGRLIPFARINPYEGEKALEELRHRMSKQGWKGVKLHPTLQGFPLESTIAFPVYDEIAKLKVPVVVHTGSEMFNTPAQLAIIAEMYPDITFIMAHMGATFLVEQAIIVAKRRDNIILESTDVKCKKLRSAVEAVGSERVVCGSDYPYDIQAHQLAKAEMSGLSSKDKDNVLGDTISKLLSI
ncbi:MAG: amidohydrolase [Nitrososphaerota archaeon]|nr:amidohydrolase [Nitrososphaerota archaeon]